MTPVMKTAQEQKVVERGLSADGPVLVVMRFCAVSRNTTTGKPAKAIADMKRQAQPLRHDPLFAPNVDRQSIPFEDTDHLGIATNPARGICRER